VKIDTKNRVFHGEHSVRGLEIQARFDSWKSRRGEEFHVEWISV